MKVNKIVDWIAISIVAFILFFVADALRLQSNLYVLDQVKQIIKTELHQERLRR